MTFNRFCLILITHVYVPLCETCPNTGQAFYNFNQILRLKLKLPIYLPMDGARYFPWKIHMHS